MSHIIVNALWPSSLPDAYITSVGILPQPQCRMGGCTSSACKSFCSMWISWIHIVVICLLPTSPHLLSFQSPFFFLLLLFHFFTLFLSIFDLSPYPFRPIWIKSLPSKKIILYMEMIGLGCISVLAWHAGGPEFHSSTTNVSCNEQHL